MGNEYRDIIVLTKDGKKLTFENKIHIIKESTKFPETTITTKYVNNVYARDWNAFYATSHGQGTY